MPTITPRLAADPMRTLRDGEPWIEWARELYAHTLAELAMSVPEWEAYFGSKHPGPGYTATLRAQIARLDAEMGML